MIVIVVIINPYTLVSRVLGPVTQFPWQVNDWEETVRPENRNYNLAIVSAATLSTTKQFILSQVEKVWNLYPHPWYKTASQQLAFLKTTQFPNNYLQFTNIKSNPQRNDVLASRTELLITHTAKILHSERSHSSNSHKITDTFLFPLFVLFYYSELAEYIPFLTQGILGSLFSL